MLSAAKHLSAIPTSPPNTKPTCCHGKEVCPACLHEGERQPVLRRLGRARDLLLPLTWRRLALSLEGLALRGSQGKARGAFSVAPGFSPASEFLLFRVPHTRFLRVGSVVVCSPPFPRPGSPRHGDLAWIGVVGKGGDFLIPTAEPTRARQIPSLFAFFSGASLARAQPQRLGYNDLPQSGNTITLSSRGARRRGICSSL